MEIQTNTHLLEQPNLQNLEFVDKNQSEDRSQENESQDISTGDEDDFNSTNEQYHCESDTQLSNKEEIVQEGEHSDCSSDGEEDETEELEMDQEQNSKFSFDISRNYKRIKTGEVIEMLKDQIKLISEEHNISLGRAYYFLRSQNYNIKECSFIPIELENQILIQQSKNHIQQQSTKQKCLLCNNKLTEENRYALDCQHQFCKDSCFKEHMNSILDLGSDMLFKTCPLEGCKERIGLKEFSQFYLTSMQRRVERFLLLDYLAQRGDSVECPYSGCKKVFIKNKSTFNKQTNIRCPCAGSLFCSSCKSEPHYPLNCDNFKTWQQLIHEEDPNILESIQYIKRYKKNCPKCKSPVEKNGRYSNMRCQQCSSHFCWDCMAITKGSFHSFCCFNRSARTLVHQSAEKEKFKLYGKGLFIQHLQAANQTNSSQAKYIRQMEEKLLPVFENEGRLKKETKFFKEALITLVETKYSFANSFASGYFMDKRFHEFLEYLQEELSQIINVFEFQLTDSVRQLYNMDKLFKNGNDVNLLTLFEEFKDCIMRQTLNIKSKLRYFITQINSDMPDCSVFQNQQREKLAEQQLIEEEILQEILKQEQLFQQEQYLQREENDIKEAVRRSQKVSIEPEENLFAMVCQVCTIHSATYGNIFCDECYVQQLSLMFEGEILDD